MQNKIIWLIPGIALIISLFCLLIKKTKTNNILKTIKISNISKESSGILVGKKQNNVYLTDASKVLIVDKKSSNDYLNSNLHLISQFANKPNMIVLDPNRDLFNANYDHLKKMKYEISSYNLSNTFIDVFKIITKKMYEIKDLELKVNNIKGQYITADETYLSYEDIRKEIKTYKDDIKKIIKEFIVCYFKYSLNDSEFLPLYCMLLTYIEKKIYQEKIVELTFDNVVAFINERSSDSIIKLKKYLNSSEDEEFLIKEEVKKIKFNKNDFEVILKKTNCLKTETKTMKIIDLEGFYTSNEIIFLNEENKESLKLFLFLLNYTHLETDLYLLSNYNAFYEFTLEKLKVIQVMTELKDVNGLDSYSVKIYRGKVINENKKEILRLCKKELDEQSDIDYKNVFNLLKLFDKIDIEKNEVLVINPRKGNVITNFEFSPSEKVLLNYSKKY